MDERKENTRKALLVAMINCLKTESFDKITTTQLAQEAHISRSGFYTHFHDKYELIDSYQQDLFSKVEYIFQKNQHDICAAFLELFAFFQSEQLLSALLSVNGTQEIQTFIINKVRRFIETDLSEKFKQDNLTPIKHEYNSVYFAHAFFGVLQHWIIKGKKESPQSITQFIIDTLPQSISLK